VSIYADAEHTQLRHSIPLSEVSAVARRRKDTKRRPSSDGLFTIYTPPRNFHFDARTEKEAEAWIDQIRSAARIDTYETALATSGDETDANAGAVAGSSGSVPKNVLSGTTQGTIDGQEPYGVSVGSFSSISSFGAANFPRSSLSLSLSPGESSNPKSEATRSRSVSQAVAEVDQERVARDGWLYLLKSKGGVKKWKPVWAVLRFKTLSIYPNEQVSLVV
jgi:hypothetical protein